MKRISLAIISAFLLSSLSAFEWGGLFDNSTAFANSSKLTQTDSVYLWGAVPLSNDGTSYIKAEGMYKFTYNSAANQISNILDLDLLKYTNTLSAGKGSLNISAGRFSVSDLSGAVFAQNCDGVFLNYTEALYNLSFYTGYTGLLNSNNVSILGDSGKDSSKVYSLADKYVPVMAAVSFPSLFLNQTLSVQADCIINTADPKKDTRSYITASLTGPLASKVFYNISSNMGTVSFENFMNYTKASVAVFTGPAFIIGGLELATGNFLGLTSHPVCSTAMGDMEASGFVIPSVSANVSLAGDMLLGASAKALISISESTKAQNGFQGDINYIYNILSDVQLTAALSAFKAFETSSLDKISATLKIAVSY